MKTLMHLLDCLILLVLSAALGLTLLLAVDVICGPLEPDWLNGARIIAFAVGFGTLFCCGLAGWVIDALDPIEEE